MQSKAVRARLIKSGGHREQCEGAGCMSMELTMGLTTESCSHGPILPIAVRASQTVCIGMKSVKRVLLGDAGCKETGTPMDVSRLVGCQVTAPLTGQHPAPAADPTHSLGASHSLNECGMYPVLLPRLQRTRPLISLHSTYTARHIAGFICVQYVGPQLPSQVYNASSG